MSLWWFRAAPAVVRSMPLLPGDRRLAWSLTTDGDPVLASAYGLTLPGQGLAEWHLVEKATWQRPALIVSLVDQQVIAAGSPAVVQGTGASCTVQLVPGGNLPEVVRAKVTESVVWSRHLQWTEGGVRVVGRRQRGAAGLAWQLVYDQGTDVHDPGVQAAAGAALDAARQTVG